LYRPAARALEYASGFEDGATATRCARRPPEESAVEFGSTTFWLVVVVAAVAVVLVLRSTRSRVPPPTAPEPGEPPVTDDTNYLDSSHISGPISGLRPGERGDRR
jgi:hypothetical protein